MRADPIVFGVVEKLEAFEYRYRVFDGGGALSVDQLRLAGAAHGIAFGQYGAATLGTAWNRAIGIGVIAVAVRVDFERLCFVVLGVCILRLLVGNGDEGFAEVATVLSLRGSKPGRNPVFSHAEICAVSIGAARSRPIFAHAAVAIVIDLSRAVFIHQRRHTTEGFSCGIFTDPDAAHMRPGCIDAIVVVVRIAVVIGIAGRVFIHQSVAIIVAGFAGIFIDQLFQRALQRVVFVITVVVNPIRWIANVSGAALDVLATARNDFQCHLQFAGAVKTGFRIAVRDERVAVGRSEAAEVFAGNTVAAVFIVVRRRPGEDAGAAHLHAVGVGIVRRIVSDQRIRE